MVRDEAVELANRILEIIFRYRRSLEDAHEERHFCEQCNHPHHERIVKFIESNQPILFVLPAFPSKSPNLNKVLGALPDRGERLALSFLNELCQEIKAIYSFGAHIKICSDGRVFNDLVGVSDEDVSAYTSEIQSLVGNLRGASLSLFDLETWTNKKDFSEMRKILVQQHAMPLTELREFIKSHPREQIMLNGIERFLFEDYLYLQPSKTRSSIRKFCHTLAYEVVQRSHAWSALIQNLFPEAIRLSIHPQPCHFEKLGIYLVPSKDNWLTPWHGVALEEEGEFTLMKRWQAEDSGAVVVEENGRPDHFARRVSEFEFAKTVAP